MSDSRDSVARFERLRIYREGVYGCALMRTRAVG
jgi:hypothetical protein